MVTLNYLQASHLPPGASDRTDTALSQPAEHQEILLSRRVMRYEPSNRRLIEKEQAGGLLIGCQAGIGYEEMVDSAQ